VDLRQVQALISKPLQPSAPGLAFETRGISLLADDFYEDAFGEFAF
jgi:hypothetical protein